MQQIQRLRYYKYQHAPDGTEHLASGMDGAVVLISGVFRDKQEVACWLNPSFFGGVEFRLPFCCIGEQVSGF